MRFYFFGWGIRLNNREEKRLKRKKQVARQKMMIFVVFFVIVLAILVAVFGNKKDKDGVHSGEMNKENVGNHQELSELTFPVLQDGNRLKIDSVFQFTGINVDADWTECEDTGAIQLTNVSETYLESTEITVMLDDQSKLVFLIEDIPAGKSVIAFEIQNAKYDTQRKIVGIDVRSTYSQEIGAWKDDLELSAEKSQITVKNKSTKPLQNFSIKYHCDIDGSFFGGKSYEKVVETLDVGESLILDATEAILGEAAVVNCSL